MIVNPDIISQNGIIMNHDMMTDDTPGPNSDILADYRQVSNGSIAAYFGAGVYESAVHLSISQWIGASFSPNQYCNYLLSIHIFIILDGDNFGRMNDSETEKGGPPYIFFTPSPHQESE
jgi:hypothetical protein